jgi:membrane fusion protein, heavy metal efflux system
MNGLPRRRLVAMAGTTSSRLGTRSAYALISTIALLSGPSLSGSGCEAVWSNASATEAFWEAQDTAYAAAPGEHRRPGHAEEAEAPPALPAAGLEDDGQHDDEGGHADEGEHDPGEEDEHDHAGEAEGRAFTVAEFERFGVRVGTAGPGLVDAAIELPGEVRPNGDRIAHLAPRFPGLAREVRKRVGDEVRAGEVMAIIEGDNLASFSLQAAFPGTVIDRHVSVGEVVGPDRAAFIVADLSNVWVEIDVYQRALDRVRPGQPVRISENRGQNVAEGVVSYVSPVVDQATRTARARVVLANPEGRWRPGAFVTVLLLELAPANVVVPRRAVHRVDRERVVFVVVGDHFEARPVTLGASGRSLVAITKGLEPGERFADEESFLVKAELAKGASAGHHH